MKHVKLSLFYYLLFFTKHLGCFVVSFACKCTKYMSYEHIRWTDQQQSWRNKMDCEKHHTKYLTKIKKGSKIKIFCLFFILHEINSANAKLIAMVVCLLFIFSRYGFDDTLSEKNARLFPSTCWQITDFVLPVSKKVKKSLVKVVHTGHLVMSEPWPRLAIVPFMLSHDAH